MRNGMALSCAFGSSKNFHLGVRYKKKELTDIEVMAGVGKRLLEYMELVQLLLGGGLWLKTIFFLFLPVILLGIKLVTSQIKSA